MRTSFKLPFRWLLLAVWLLCGLSVPMRAEHVRTEDARRAAYTFLRGCGGRCNDASELTDVSEVLGFSHLYAFNGSKGYVVLAADNSVSPVLCFSPDGCIDAAHLPENFRWWLEGYEEQINYVVEHQIRATPETVSRWEDLIGGRIGEMVLDRDTDAQLYTRWGQANPYNLLCPYNNAAQQRCKTGSVATAMAQIMKKWEHPKQGRSSHSNGANYSQYGNLEANFGETVYDWAHMTNTYEYGWFSSPTEEEEQAVAVLMKHCGVAVDMIYSYQTETQTTQGSYIPYASNYKIGDAFRNFFYYKCPYAKQRIEYSDSDWRQLLKDALDATPPRPVLYLGKNENDIAHAFVCDGWMNFSGSELFHINWGMDDLLDNWCYFDQMAPGFYPAYDRSQCAYFGIEPDSANIIVTKSPYEHWGTVTGEGRYPKGNTVTVTAAPAEGFEFESWYKIVDGTTYYEPNASAEYTFVVNENAVYQANFRRIQCVITTEVDPEGAGATIGGGTYYYGEYCNLMASANPGYAFVGWFEGQTRVSYEPYLQLCVGRSRNLTARFVAANYNIQTACFPPSWGNVSGAGTYPASSTVTLTATPTAGHRFLGWVENGIVVSGSASYTFQLSGDRTLVACFGTTNEFGIGSVVTNADGSKGVVFYIDPTGAEGWMVALNDLSEGCQWGPSTNIEALPDLPSTNLLSLEEVSGFRNTGLIRTALGTDNDYAASLVDYEHGWYLPAVGQLRKIYSALPFIEEAIAAQGGTTLTEDTYWSSTEYSTSDACTPMFALGNSGKTSNRRVRAVRSFMVGGDNRVVVEANHPSYGVINSNGSQFTYGSTVTVVANANPGYVFDHWSEEGLPVSYNRVYEFTFKRSRHLVAHFVVSGGIGTVVHNADGSDGVVFYVDTDGTEGLMVALEDASEGCQWGPTTNVMTLTDRPLNDIQALEDVAGYHNTGILRSVQNADTTYAAGLVDYENGWYLPASGELRKLYAALPLIESALVRAGGHTLTEGTYWSSTEYSTSDASTPMFSMGNTNKTSSCRVRAIRKFLPSGINSLVAKSQDTLMGTVTGSGTYTYNQTVTVSAVANEGFVFDSWTEDGLVVSYNATYQFPFTRNRVLVANFRVTGTVGEIVHNADGSTGVVFYQNAEGTEGWMVALEDASEGCPWGPTTNINAMPDMLCNDIRAMEDVSGYSNTDMIRKVLGTDNNYAASVVDFANGWYLPSAGQLRKLYAALPMIEESILNAGGTLLTEDAYWSSSEYSSSDACSPMFAMNNSNKNSSLRVRAVRTFNCSSTNMIRVKSNNLAFGGVAGGGNFELGATVNVMASPSTGYVFDHWEEDGCVVSYNQLYTFTFTRTRTLMAVFVRENSIGSVVHNSDGTTGVIFYTYPSGTGGLMVALEDVSEGCPWGLNEDITILDNQSPSSVMDLLNDMCGKNNTNRIREWYFGNTEYAACKTDYANGWYLPSVGQLRKLYAALPLIERAIVDAGGTTMTEDAYWSSTEQSASNAWIPSFAMNSTSKTNNCRVRAIRSLTDTKTILANVNIVGAGTVMGTGLYDYGQPCTLKAQANESYAFLNWTCGGTVVSTNMEYSFTVWGNQTYTANFVANSCNITTAMDPAGSGTVTGAGVYAIGSNCTLTATPHTGYSFSNWTKGNNQVSTQSTYSFTVTESAQYTAHFVINSYAVNATVFPEEGGSVSGAQTYTHGSMATLTATPAEGYTFVNWTENGVVVSTSPTYQFVVTGNRTLQANFSNNAYTVTAIAYPENGGTIEGAGVYEYGTLATLTAIANFGYEFFCWFEDDDMVSFEPSVSFEVTEDVEVYAVFVEGTTVLTKEIDAYTEGGGYYLLAVPLTEVNPEEVEYMLDNVYDLYAYDEAEELEWRNYKGQAFNLQLGKGYLYANSEDVTLAFTGTPNIANCSVTLSKTGNAETAGWNLVGNPFNQTTYLNRSFYVMKADGSEIIAAQRNYIMPMEGVFVVANYDGETIAFTQAKSANDDKRIVLNLSEGDYSTGSETNVIDRAIVRFDEGQGLPKFQINENSTKLFIQQDDKDYAVVCADGEGELPIYFKAEKNGTYMLSFVNENVGFSYLHLIDNLTGVDINLLETPSYTFKASATDSVSRFKLVYKSR